MEKINAAKRISAAAGDKFPIGHIAVNRLATYKKAHPVKMGLRFYPNGDANVIPGS
jgi:hypothetical protein